MSGLLSAVFVWSVMYCVGWGQVDWLLFCLSLWPMVLVTPHTGQVRVVSMNVLNHKTFSGTCPTHAPYNMYTHQGIDIWFASVVLDFIDAARRILIHPACFGYRTVAIYRVLVGFIWHVNHKNNSRSDTGDLQVAQGEAIDQMLIITESPQ